MRHIVWSDIRPAFTYWTPDGDKTVKLGDDDIVAILVNDGEAVEWFTADTPRETVENFAGDAADMHIRATDVDDGTPVVRWAVAWRNLVADNRGTSIDVVTA